MARQRLALPARRDKTGSGAESGRVSELYLEDLNVGDRFGSDTIEVTKESIFEFARQYDPQPFHLDEKAAEESIFKELTASGWHTAAMSMRLFVTGEFKPVGGSIGLAVDELRWPQPVRPGDILKVETEILDVRKSRSKPDRGIIRIRNVTTNQRGEVVQTFMAFVMVRRRPAST
jgi:acyl dehydratase